MSATLYFPIKEQNLNRVTWTAPRCLVHWSVPPGEKMGRRGAILSLQDTPNQEARGGISDCLRNSGPRARSWVGIRHWWGQSCGAGFRAGLEPGHLHACPTPAPHQPLSAAEPWLLARSAIGTPGSCREGVLALSAGFRTTSTRHLYQCLG